MSISEQDTADAGPVSTPAADKKAVFEAEEALFALGEPRLPWRSRGTELESYQAWVGEALYSCGADGVGGLFTALYSSRATRPSPILHGKYPTLAAAKIACEYHHATGKWK